MMSSSGNESQQACAAIHFDFDTRTFIRQASDFIGTFKSRLSIPRTSAAHECITHWSPQVSSLPDLCVLSSSCLPRSACTDCLSLAVGNIRWSVIFQHSKGQIFGPLMCRLITYYITACIRRFRDDEKPSCSIITLLKLSCCLTADTLVPMWNVPDVLWFTYLYYVSGVLHFPQSTEAVT